MLSVFGTRSGIFWFIDKRLEALDSLYQILNIIRGYWVHQKTRRVEPIIGAKIDIKHNVGGKFTFCSGSVQIIYYWKPAYQGLNRKKKLYYSYNI